MIWPVSCRRLCDGFRSPPQLFLTLPPPVARRGEANLEFLCRLVEEEQPALVLGWSAFADLRAMLRGTNRRSVMSGAGPGETPIYLVSCLELGQRWTALNAGDEDGPETPSLMVRLSL